MFLAAGGILGQGLRQCTTGLVIEATRHSVLFIDPQGEAFPLIGENTWAACRSRQEDLSCLDEFIGIILFHQSDVLKYGHLEQIALPNNLAITHPLVGTWVCFFCCFYLSRYLDHVANDDRLQCSRHSEHPGGQKVDYQQASRGKAWKRYIPRKLTYIGPEKCLQDHFPLKMLPFQELC